MLSVPSGHAKTCSVLALAVIIAARIAKLRIAQFAIPAIVTLTLVVDTSPVHSAAEITKLQRAIISAELQIAITFLCVWVEFSMIRAVGQAGNGSLVFH